MSARPCCSHIHNLAHSRQRRPFFHSFFLVSGGNFYKLQNTQSTANDKAVLLSCTGRKRKISNQEYTISSTHGSRARVKWMPQAEKSKASRPALLPLYGLTRLLSGLPFFNSSWNRRENNLVTTAEQNRTEQT